MPGLDDIKNMILQGDESVEKILAKLLDKKDIEMKTEIPNPQNLVLLKAYGDWLTASGLKNSGAFVDSLVKTFMLYMVSYDRKRSTEIITALAEALKREKSLTEKMTTPP